MKCLASVFISLSMLVGMVSSAPGQCRRDIAIISNNSMCPTWFIYNSIENSCQCGKDHNRVIACNSERLVSAVLDCHCVTYDQDTECTHLGSCFYNCDHYNSFDRKRDPIYNKLPTKPELLINDSACTPFHRTGLLCGDCEQGRSPLVFSYDLSCVKCPDGHKNWWKFILVAFVPLTFFYFFVVVFNINVTSSRLHGVVWFSQAISAPSLVRLVVIPFTYRKSSFLIAHKVTLVFHSFWNLDILRSVMPDICLNVTPSGVSFGLPTGTLSFSTHYLVVLHH